MIKDIEKFFILGISLLIAFSAKAKVTPVHEYNPSAMRVSTEEESMSCQSFGYFAEIQPDAVCSKKKLVDGTECYDCRCGNEYQYSCSKTGLSAPEGASCTINGVTKYSHCECASNYIDGTNVTKSLGSIYYPPAVEEGGAVCYKMSDFACASGYKEFTSNPSEEGISYTTETPYSGSNLKCVSGYTATSKYMEKIPSSGYDCLTYNSVYLSSLKTPINLYYFTGCSDNANCSSSMQDCVAYNSQYHSASGIRCYRAIGCKSGTIIGDSVCANDASSASSFLDYTTYSEGSYTCSKIKGCKSNYEEVFFNGFHLKDVTEFESDNTTRYDVKSFAVDNGNGNIICRAPNGCVNSDLYDVSSCWGGRLAWFVPDGADIECLWGKYYNIFSDNTNINYHCSNNETGYILLKSVLGQDKRTVSVIPNAVGVEMPIPSYTHFAGTASFFCSEYTTSKYSAILSSDILYNKAFTNIYSSYSGDVCVATIDKILHFNNGKYQQIIDDNSKFYNFCQNKLRFHCKMGLEIPL